jgi:hypothetical protein
MCLELLDYRPRRLYLNRRLPLQLQWASKLARKGEITMKKSVVFIALIGMTMLLGGLPSFAQTAYNFHAPAGFYAGNAKLPAGTYTLKQSQDDPQMWELQNSAGSHSVLLEARQSSKASKGKPEVLFNKYGGTDYLEGIETSTGNSIDIQVSAAEKMAAKKGTATPHTVPTA